MARRLDLIDQFTELVVGADDPRRLAERTLEVVMSLLNGRSSAVCSLQRSTNGMARLAAARPSCPYPASRTAVSTLM